ncbi:carbamoyltransferase C-terminal domain-containing protein [Streptomyces sp. NBC_01367]|uniref:carbamoyltransferase C-terminal domain-containing protein n=1 Tax=Streptomyces sp. NBC_01367 TaxID=2903841 RepID=UPI00324A4C34
MGHALTLWSGLQEKALGAKVAEQLANGLTLGNRSILASLREPRVIERLNDSVKCREPFRPCAPVVPAERAPAFFTLGQARRRRACRRPPA